MNKAQEFMNYAINELRTIMEVEAENIEKAAVAVKDTMARGGMLYTFGTGHSTMLCMETFRRAGGLAACCPILEDRLMPHLIKKPEDVMLERKEGITAEVFQRYPFKKGDTMLVYCYGGKNATSVDACLLCKELGITSIGISSVEHANAVGAHHSSGLLVHQACDISIDNHGPVGDAAIEFDGFTAGPISTLAGAAIAQAITCRAIELMLEENIKPEVFLSSNVPAGDEFNKPMMEKYRKIIPFM